MDSLITDANGVTLAFEDYKWIALPLEHLCSMGCGPQAKRRTESQGEVLMFPRGGHFLLETHAEPGALPLDGVHQANTGGAATAPTTASPCRPEDPAARHVR